MINTALIGSGYWGIRLLGYVNSHSEFHVRHICNSKTDMSKVWDSVEAVVIATPIKTHYKIAKEALTRGKHVFVEKPITLKKAEAENLKKLAERQNLALFTDLTWTFSRALRKAQCVDIGSPRIIEIILKRPHRGAVIQSAYWVLGPHALSILDMFVSLKHLRFQKATSAVGSGSIWFRCKNPRGAGLIGKIAVSINHPQKETRVAIYGSNGVVVYKPAEGAVIINGERHVFDEGNNLKYAIDNFYKIINGEIESNIDRAILVTKILEKL